MPATTVANKNLLKLFSRTKYLPYNFSQEFLEILSPYQGTWNL